MEVIGWGVELVANGSFDTDTDWNKGAGWTISGGTANALNTTININQSIPYVQNATYRFSYSIVEYTAGNLRPEYGTNAGVLRSALGNYTDVLTPTGGADNLFIYGTTAFTGSIDSVSLKRLLETV